MQQRLAACRVQMEPFASLDRLQHRRVVAQSLDQRGTVEPPGNRRTEVRLQLLERRDRSEERDLLAIEPRQDRFGEQGVQSRLARRDAAQRCDRVRVLFDIDEQEL